jgi:hydroxymethylbilane synthase
VSASALRLGTRGSQLALWQAHAVAKRVAESGGPTCEIVVITTSGDTLQSAPLSEIGGKRLFVKEIEDALLRNEIDLAVHSSKDMPAVLPEGLVIAGVLPREDPLDAIVLPARSGSEAEAVHARPPLTIESLVAALGQTPSLGTGSVRRIAQLTRLWPNADFANIRGNLDTRLRKLDEGAHDALVLAAAGLRRLGFGSRISLAIPATACVPAPGQGIVAVEVRASDRRAADAVARIDDAAAHGALAAERGVVEALGGGCQTPIGALASPLDRDTFELIAIVVALDGSRAVRASARGSFAEAAQVGLQVAAQLRADGADEILAEVHSHQSSVASRQL